MGDSRSRHVDLSGDGIGRFQPANSLPAPAGRHAPACGLNVPGCAGSSKAWSNGHGADTPYMLLTNARWLTLSLCCPVYVSTTTGRCVTDRRHLCILRAPTNPFTTAPTARTASTDVTAGGAGSSPTFSDHVERTGRSRQRPSRTRRALQRRGSMQTNSPARI